MAVLLLPLYLRNSWMAKQVVIISFGLPACQKIGVHVWQRRWVRSQRAAIDANL